MAILFLGKACRVKPPRSLWNGSYDYSWMSVKSNKYEIDTPEKFAAFCKLSQSQKSILQNSEIELKCDVEFYPNSKEKYKQWYMDNPPRSNDPMDDYMLQMDIPESCIFKGNNHTIKGIFTIAENIINLRSSSCIRNLNIKYSKCIHDNATVIKPSIYSTIENFNVAYTDILDTSEEKDHKISFLISGNDTLNKGSFVCYKCIVEGCCLISTFDNDLSSSAFIFASVGSNIVGEFTGLCLCNSEYAPPKNIELLRLPDDLGIKYIATYNNSNIITSDRMIVEFDSIERCKYYIQRI